MEKDYPLTLTFFVVRANVTLTAVIETKYNATSYRLAIKQNFADGFRGIMINPVYFQNWSF